ncbi:hypothetical protein [Photobacterium jeanii]|uniref:hypothetical protein n=1 Tax=Photobacterium jeanii TaxID=858640 RepID=UPI000B07C912|nr:hypothetical protein [Photobacterium jeanii]
MKFPLIIEQRQGDNTVSAVVHIQLTDKLVSLKQIIELKVRAEIANKVHEAQLRREGKEWRLNAHAKSYVEHYDIDAEVNRAIEHFQRNGFFVLVNDKQITALNQMIVWREDLRITFLQLVPLIGG